MKTLAKIYVQRIKNARKVLHSAAMGRYFVPFAYLTVLLGCWNNIDSFGTAKMGDVSVSVAVTTLLGVFIYGFGILSVVHAILY